MKTKMRNCPRCHGKGQVRTDERCEYCDGNKRVSSAFVKWDDLRSDRLVRVSARVDRDLDYLREKMVDEKMFAWDKDNPRPRKYEKKN